MKNRKGLTLMELTIVLAVIAIVAAILVPLFLMTTDRARLRGDIASARVIQSAIDIYIAERGSTALMRGDDVSAIVTRLAAAGYLNPRNTSIQTSSGTWHANWVRFTHDTYGRMIGIDIANAPDEIHRAFASLPADERVYVRNGDLTR